jgi:predicted metal-binding transcription factor (methanogenesis marker protein 9)
LVDEMSREELIEVLEKAFEMLAGHLTPEAMRARVLGQVEIFKENARENIRNL